MIKDDEKMIYQNITENIDIDDIYKLISIDIKEVKLEENKCVSVRSKVVNIFNLFSLYFCTF